MLSVQHKEGRSMWQEVVQVQITAAAIMIIFVIN